MLTIDAQVHAYERDQAGRPWKDVLTGPPEVTSDAMVAAMVHSPIYGPMINHRNAKYENVRVEGELARIDVILNSKEGEYLGYRFVLSRQQGNQYEGSWMAIWSLVDPRRNQRAYAVFNAAPSRQYSGTSWHGSTPRRTFSYRRSQIPSKHRVYRNVHEKCSNLSWHSNYGGLGDVGNPLGRAIRHVRCRLAI